MKTTEVNKELIGRRCECIFTGLMVTGVIEDTEENEHTIEVKVRFDHPHQWGDDLYNDVWAWGAQNRRVRHAASFATVGGQTGLSDNDGSFRRANQPDRPQCFCRCGHVGRLFLARLGKQL